MYKIATAKSFGISDENTNNTFIKKDYNDKIMALIATGLQSMLIGQFAANGLLGQSSAQLAAALSQGITLNILATAQVSTVDTGTAGAGVGASKVLGVNPGALTPMMIGQFAAQGMLGTMSSALANAISNAFCIWFLASNQTTTVHSGVGAGVGQGVVTGLSPSGMENMITGMMAANGLLGTYSPKLASAVANSIVPHLLSMGTVITPIAGPPSPTASTGTGSGKVL
jgi:hypothetical protein